MVRRMFINTPSLVGWGLEVEGGIRAGSPSKVLRDDVTLSDVILSAITLAHASSFPEGHTQTHT